jgi:hypothetical protein
MRVFKFLILFSIVSTISFSIFAQGPGPGRKFSKEDIDKFRAVKVSFITEKLQLTPNEAQKFWPIYNMAEKEDWDNQNKRHEIEFKVRFDKGDITEKEYIDLSKQLVETYKAEALMREKFNKKFLEILPPKKVLLLYQTEQDFVRHMVKNFDNFKNRGSNP